MCHELMALRMCYYDVGSFQLLSSVLHIRETGFPVLGYLFIIIVCGIHISQDMGIWLQHDKEISTTQMSLNIVAIS